MGNKYDDYIANSLEPSEKTPYIEPGVYWVLLGAFKEVPKAKGNTGRHKLSNVIEMTVLRILTERESSNQPGTRMGWVIKDDNDYYGGELQKVVAGIMGCPTKEISGKEISEAFEDGALSGFVVRLEAESVPTKAGGVWTRTTFCGIVSWAAVAEHVDPDLLETFFPDGVPSDDEE